MSTKSVFLDMLMKGKSIYIPTIALVTGLYFQAAVFHAEAQNVAEEISVESSAAYLNQLDQQLSELQATELDFHSFFKEVSGFLSFYESNDILRDRFLQSEVNIRLQALTLRRLTKAYNEKQPNLDDDLRTFIGNLTKIYPTASSFIFKLREEEKKIAAVSECEGGVGFPSCIWTLILNSPSPEKDFSVLDASIDRALKSKDVDLLSKLILLAAKTDYLKAMLGSKTCEGYLGDSGAIRNYFPQKLDDQELSSVVKVLHSSVNEGSECLEQIKEQFETVAQNLCSRGFASSCLSAISFFEARDVPDEKLDILRKSFIVSVTDPESKEIASGMVTKGVFSQLNFQERFKLLINGTLPSSVYVVIFIIVMLPILFGVIYFVFPALLGMISKISSAFGENSNVNPTEQLRDDEYSTLLKIFGLADDASSSDIKKAYRSMVKLHHPDSADQEAQAEFEKVQEAYERLIELRKGWFGLGKD